MNSGYPRSLSSLLWFLMIVAVVGMPPSIHADCGGPPPAITSVSVSTFNDDGTFTVVVGYNQYTDDISWSWAGGPNGRAELYLGGGPNPYPLTFSAACMIGAQELRLTASNCIGYVAVNVDQIVTIQPPDPTPKISKVSLLPPANGNTTELKFDYEFRYSNPNSRTLHVVNVSPYHAGGTVYQRPDSKATRRTTMTR